MQPDAVDHHARRQRMIGLSKPARQREPVSTAAVVFPGPLDLERLETGSQHRRYGRGNPLEQRLRLAAAQQIDRRRLTAHVVESANPGLGLELLLCLIERFLGRLPKGFELRRELV